MAELTFTPGKTKQLSKLCSAMTNAIVESLKSLVDQPLALTQGSLEVTSAEQITSSITKQSIVVRADLDKDYEGRTLRFVFAGQEATALAGFMMMSSEEDIQEKRKPGQVDAEDLEAFGDVSNVLCAGVDGVLRENFGSTVGLKLHDHGLIDPSADPDALLGSEQFLAFTYGFKVGGFEESQAMILMDLESAEAWNEGSLFDDGTDDHAAGDTANDDLPSLEDIPSREIRGKLACYLCDTSLIETLRMSCRRVGLELDRHPTCEVPNPAAHKKDVVLMDVPIGEERRFEWCKRIKQYDPGVMVVVLIHHPSKKRVLQGFMTKADIILGWPVDETVLSAKLNQLLDPPQSDDADLD
ncbi:MAG: hypothetical protein ACYTG5_09430 [Planctomycetota bacterium]|jgi:CheY-like chemotaxis protein